MVNITAATALSNNGFTTTDLAAADVETLIDDAIYQVNLDASQTMTPMTGATPNKTVTVTGPQSVPLKILITLRLRETKKTSLSSSSNTSGSTSTSRSISVGPISTSEGGSVSSAIAASSSINTDANTTLKGDYDRAIRRLIGRNFQRA